MSTEGPSLPVPPRSSGRPARAYLVRCAACGSEWADLDADDAGLGPGEARALCVCVRCCKVTSAAVKVTASELSRYRRDLLKTVQKMHQAFAQARARLEDRRRVLADELQRSGTRSAAEKLAALERRLAGLRPPETSQLESRARELEAVERSAPAGESSMRCETCGSPLEIYRESHRGFELPCPRCTERLTVELRTR